MATKKRASVYMLRVTDSSSSAFAPGDWVRDAFCGSGTGAGITGGERLATKRWATVAQRFAKERHGVRTEIVRFVEVPK